MMRLKFLNSIVISVLCLFGSSGLQAASAVQQLGKLLDNFANYSAQFEQFSQDQQGRAGEVSKGNMRVLRPNKFYWETVTPFPQLNVRDGNYSWIYDEDLEQVTRKKVQPDEANGAALILNGNITALSKKFIISQLINRGDEQLFELLPKTESNFEKIQLLFVGKILQELMLVDILGKQTSIILSQAKLNQTFKSGLFTFIPPPGTDVMIDNSGSQ